MSFDEDEADYQVFRIAAFITAGRERLTVSEYTDKIDTTPGLAYPTTVCQYLSTRVLRINTDAIFSVKRIDKTLFIRIRWCGEL